MKNRGWLSPRQCWGVISLFACWMYFSQTLQASELIADSFRFPLEGDWSPSRRFAKAFIPDRCGFHLGDDIPRDPGTLVFPTGKGKVKLAQIVPQLGYAVIIEHLLSNGSQVTSVYYHLRRPEDGGIELILDREVNTDTALGFVSGREGDYGSRPHLHFGIRKGSFIPPSGWPDQRTEKWFYPGYTTIYQDGIRQCNEFDPAHSEIISEWTDLSDLIQDNRSALYGISTTGTLLSIDTNTGAIAPVGDPGFSFNPGGLAYNPTEDNFYTIETNSLNRLVRIDRGTGAAQVVGTISNFFAPTTFDIPSVTGLTFGPNNQLYGTQFHTQPGDTDTASYIFRISPSLGYTAIRGRVSPGTYFNGLSYDDSSSTMYISVKDRQILAGEPDFDSDGNIVDFTFVAVTSDFGDPPGQIELNVSGSALLGIRRTDTEQHLVTVDINTGDSSAIPIGTQYLITGLALAPR